MPHLENRVRGRCTGFAPAGQMACPVVNFSQMEEKILMMLHDQLAIQIGLYWNVEEEEAADPPCRRTPAQTS